MPPFPRHPLMLLLLLALPATGQLAYVESSAGLDEPGLESGRTELAFGDVDGDGNPDLVSLGDHGNPNIGSDQQGIMVWFGDGAGQWSLVMSGNLGYGGVALGDVDGDGILDIGYGIHHDYSATDLGDQLLEVALGNGTGQDWQPWDDGLATAGEAWGMFGTDFADVDNDGDLDIGSVSFGSGAGLQVYLNQGDGTWAHAFGFLGGNSSMLFVFGDIDGDGNADLAASHGAGTVYRGDGQGGFILADAGLPAPAWRDGIALGDVTADGRDDLAFATPSGAAAYTWQGGAWHDLSGDLATVGAGVEFTRIADMDGDGFGDVVLITEDAVSIHLGDGTGQWELAATIPTADACDIEALIAGVDVDHNGRADLAYVAEEDCRWLVGGTNQLHLFREASAPTAAAIVPVSPRGGEAWVAGSVRFIDWHAAIASGQPTVTIELSTAGASGPFAPVAEAVPCNGRYQWTVPANLPTSPDCHLRLTLNTDPPVVATTPAPFTILGAEVTAAEPPPRPSTARITAAPNPFNPRTSFHVTMPGSAQATVTIHDLRGRLVRSLPLGTVPAGDRQVSWDGRDAHGDDAPAGVYLARLVTATGVLARTSVALVR